MGNILIFHLKHSNLHFLPFHYTKDIKKRERLSVGTVPTVKMHPVGTVPTVKMHPVGTVPTVKMHPVGTVPTDKMHPVGTQNFSSYIF